MLSMRTIDLSPLERSFIGADHLTQLVKAAYLQSKQQSYPPYNIESLEKDKYQITVAVAGFKREEIEVEAHDNKLTVKGVKATQDSTNESAKYLHKGISDRNFNHSFQLGDHIRVDGADMENGLLSIQLKRVVPDELKPRKIEIN